MGADGLNELATAYSIKRIKAGGGSEENRAIFAPATPHLGVKTKCQSASVKKYSPAGDPALAAPTADDAAPVREFPSAAFSPTAPKVSPLAISKKHHRAARRHGWKFDP